MQSFNETTSWLINRSIDPLSNTAQYYQINMLANRSIKHGIMHSNKVWLPWSVLFSLDWTCGPTEQFTADVEAAVPGILRGQPSHSRDHGLGGSAVVCRLFSGAPGGVRAGMADSVTGIPRNALGAVGRCVRFELEKCQVLLGPRRHRATAAGNWRNRSRTGINLSSSSKSFGWLLDYLLYVLTI